MLGDALEPRICPHCREMNSPMSSYCHICGNSLDEGAERSADFFAEYVRIILRGSCIKSFISTMGQIHSDI